MKSYSYFGYYLFLSVIWAGTAYLVFERDQSGWLFLLTMFVHSETNEPKS